jgi:hypothetical protein
VKIKIINSDNIRELLEEYEHDIAPVKDDKIVLADGRKCFVHAVTTQAGLDEIIVRASIMATAEDLGGARRGGPFTTRLI